MSVSDRKFRIKTAQPCHSDCYCFGKWPLCSGKLERTRGAIHASLSPSSRGMRSTGNGPAGPTWHVRQMPQGPLPHPCLAETLTPRPGTVRPRQTAWLSRLDRSSLSSPEAIAATASLHSGPWHFADQLLVVPLHRSSSVGIGTNAVSLMSSSAEGVPAILLPPSPLPCRRLEGAHRAQLHAVPHSSWRHLAQPRHVAPPRPRKWIARPPGGGHAPAGFSPPPSALRA